MGTKNNVPRDITAYLSTILKELSRPQRSNFLLYLTGLIWMIKFRSIREIVREFSHKSIDALHHFISNTPQASTAINHAHKKQTAHMVNATNKATIIIDDTTCSRKGKHIEDIGYHRGADGLVKGLCAVSVIIRTTIYQFAWALTPYYQKRYCLANTFKTKIQLADEHLCELIKTITVPVLVLMDSWYSCAQILTRIQHAHWQYVAAIKSNRVVYRKGRKITVSTLAKMRSSRYRTVKRPRSGKPIRVAWHTVSLAKIGMVRLCICRDQKEINYFICNDWNVTAQTIMEHYWQRFHIEHFHKDIKQHLGFEELFMRKRHGIQKHWLLVVIAYNTIILWNTPHNESFRQKIFCFRKKIAHHKLFRVQRSVKIAA